MIRKSHKPFERQKKSRNNFDRGTITTIV